MASRTSRTPLARGREALARQQWGEARSAFEQALSRQERPEAHEGLSWVAWWQDDADTVLRERETAFKLYRQRGDDAGAARMAMWLAADYADFRGELSIANGWRQRARRLLDDVPLCAEHAWARLLAGDAALLLDGNAARARLEAEAALAIGRELGLGHFEILGLALKGLALVDEGEVDTGLRMLDEAAVAALTEDLDQPFWNSWVLCYLLFACERVRDVERASQWCEKLREYAERLQMPAGLGVCRVHYAAVLIWRGEWKSAEEHLSEAAELLAAARPPWVVEAFVRLADLRRKQGRLEEAKEIYGRAEWHPMAIVGMAELALDAGRPRDAHELVERALRDIPVSSRHQRALALEQLVRAQTLLGQHERAAKTLAELETLSGAIASPPLRAATAYSAGIMAMGSGRHEEAMRCFEDAVGLFERIAAPYEEARARLELAIVLSALARVERARSEAASAHQILQRLGSAPYAARAEVVLRGLDRRDDAPAARSGAALTGRQREVLRLISRGQNDREIASSLGVSEHTVHRHVANILLRLDVTTRAAAAADATRRGLL